MADDAAGRPGEQAGPVRHRPLIPVLAGFALGIALDGALRPEGSLWIVPSLAAVLGALLGARRGLRPWGNWLLAFILLVPAGGLCHYVRFRSRPPWHLANLKLTPGSLYYVRGRVTREPEVQYRARPFQPDLPGRRFWLFRLEATGLSADGKSWQRTAGGLTAFMHGESPPELEVADEVEFLARVTKNRPPTNPGERDLALRYARRGSFATASLGSLAGLRVVRRGRWFSSPSAAVGRLRSLIRRRLARVLPRSDSGLIMALLLGQRSALTPSQDRLLRESGTIHFLAISGLHVGIFCVFASGLLAIVGLPVGLRSAMTIGLVWAYVAFTGSHVPAVRAGWVISLMLAAPLLGRQWDSLSALAGSALIILIAWPQELFSPGFRLTFVAVWAIVCIYPQLSDMLWPWRDLLGRATDPQERSLRSDLWLVFRSHLLLSCVAWVATAPLRARDFNVLCFLAPVLNVVVWPLVLMLLLVCLGLGASMLLWGLGAALFAGPAVLLSRAIEHVLSFASHLPGYGVYVASPPPWWVGLFYAALAAWVLRRRLPRGRVVVMASALVLALGLVGQDVARACQGGVRLTVADVGTGQAALVQVPRRRAVLFGAGSSSPARGRALVEMLRASGVDRLGAVVVSNLAMDRCVFLPALERQFGVDVIVLPKAGQLSVPDAMVRRWARSVGAPLRLMSKGDSLMAGALSCEVLHQNARFLADRSGPEGDRSLVVRCECGPLSILFAGDVGERALERLSRDYGGRLRSDVLVMPQNGRYAAGLEAFVGQVRPAVAIVSGEEGDCDRRTAALLRRAAVPLWITGREGAIIVELRRGRCYVRGYASGRTLWFVPSGASASGPGTQGREGQG